MCSVARISVLSSAMRRSKKRRSSSNMPPTSTRTASCTSSCSPLPASPLINRSLPRDRSSRKRAVCRRWLKLALSPFSFRQQDDRGAPPFPRRVLCASSGLSLRFPFSFRGSATLVQPAGRRGGTAHIVVGFGRKEAPMPQEKDVPGLLGDLIAKARRAGADQADAVLLEGVSLSHAQRLGRTEKLERSEGYDLGLRVLIGKRQAIVSSNDRAPERLGELIERAVAMAKAVPEDPYCGLAEPDEIARHWPELDMGDPAEPSRESLIAHDGAAEGAARPVPGVRKSGG